MGIKFLQQTFPPDSLKCKLWNCLIFIFAIYATIVPPVIIIFTQSPKNLLSTISLIISFIFLLDIFVRLHTGFYYRMVLVSDLNVIRKKYLKGWFFADLLAALPYELLFLLIPVFASHPVFYLVAILRVLKLFHVSSLIGKNSTLNPPTRRLLFLVLFILFFAHYIACIWLVLRVKVDFSTANFNMVMFNQYLQSYFWTIRTLITKNYGEVAPDKDNNIQMFFVIFVQIVGAGAYAFVIGSIASFLAKLDKAKSDHNEKVDSINDFLKYHNVPSILSIKINDYFGYHWETRRGYDEKEIMNELPLSLKTALSIQINKKMIGRVPLFKDAEDSFLEEIILELESVIYTPNDIIVKTGDIGSDMFFIKKGSVNVFSANGAVKLATLSNGDFFGEIALLKEVPRTATIVANEYCDLYKLNKNVFDSILLKDSKFALAIQKKAADRRLNENSLES